MRRKGKKKKRKRRERDEKTEKKRRREINFLSANINFFYGAKYRNLKRGFLPQ